MEQIKQFTDLELNIKAIEAMGLRVKDNAMVPTIGQDQKAFFQLKDLDPKKGIVSFYFAGYDNIDSDGDVIKKGSYNKTFKEMAGRIKHLMNHSKVQSPGVPVEFGEDNAGAWVVSQLTKTTLGKDTLIEYEAGVITEHSHGFKVVKENYDQQLKANIITEMMLWEVTSLTAWGANQNTPTRSIKEADIETLIKNIESVLHSSSISDEGGKRLEEKLNQLLADRKKIIIPAPAANFDLLKNIKF